MTAELSVAEFDGASPRRAKKPLPAAIRDGRAHWQRQLRLRIEATQRALDAGDLQAAEKFLRRARVCERALQRWDAVERQGIASGELAS